MELKGKKIAFLGDSITEGVGVSSPEALYWQLIGQQTGAECFGYGISGTRIAPQLEPIEPVDTQYFGTRVDQMIPDADVIVIFGGSNDFGHGTAPIGTITDRTLDTFYGAYHCLLLQIIERYPEAQIVAMTPLHRETEDDPIFIPRLLRRQGKLSVYAQAIRDVAEFYGVPVVDLYRNCMIQPRVPILKEKYAPDGLHPNDAGHQLIARAVLGVLKQL